MNDPRRTHRLLLVLPLVLILAAPVAGGTIVHLLCKGPDCAFAADVRLGGGRMVAQATGWCTRCEAFTAVTWTRSGPAPASPGKVWTAATGEVTPLYTCPKCSGPYLPIASRQEFKNCPKCSRPSLDVKVLGLYD